MELNWPSWLAPIASFFSFIAVISLATQLMTDRLKKWPLVIFLIATSIVAALVYFQDIIVPFLS